jgi:hypothetical protein
MLIFPKHISPILLNSEIEAIESSVPPGQPPGNPAQTVIDIIAVFGAMFVAAVAIILITVYIR